MLFSDFRRNALLRNRSSLPADDFTTFRKALGFPEEIVLDLLSKPRSLDGVLKWVDPLFAYLLTCIKSPTCLHEYTGREVFWRFPDKITLEDGLKEAAAWNLEPAGWRTAYHIPEVSKLPGWDNTSYGPLVKKILFCRMIKDPIGRSHIAGFNLSDGTVFPKESEACYLTTEVFRPDTPIGGVWWALRKKN